MAIPLAAPADVPRGDGTPLEYHRPADIPGGVSVSRETSTPPITARCHDGQPGRGTTGGRAGAGRLAGAGRSVLRAAARRPRGGGAQGRTPRPGRRDPCLGTALLAAGGARRADLFRLLSLL